MPEHAEAFKQPGACPRCGMRLIERSDLGRRSVAILLFEGVQIIDFSAPYEVFGQAGWNVFTVGPGKEPVTTAMGLKVTPAYAFDDAPSADVVVLPGGNLRLEDRRIVDWVRARSEHASVVLSVCNGAFWLAKAGLLDGLTATTFHRAIDSLQAAAPKTRVVRDRRFVDNGTIVTAAGLTSGMDGALHVLEKVVGRDKAREVALKLEYDWRPDTEYARASLADRYLPNLDLGTGASFEPTSSLGDLDHWRIEGVLRAPGDASDLLGRIAEQVARVQWTPVASDDGAKRAFRFSDERGRPWQAAIALAPGSAPGAFQASLSLDRRP
jgi:putative intracellular protease/amidase